MSQSAILSKLHNNDLIPNPELDDKEPTVVVADFSSLSEKEQTIVFRRLDYLNALEKIKNIKWTVTGLKAPLKNIAKELGDEKPPGVASIFRWKKYFDESGGDVMSLQTNTHKRGNKSKRVEDQEEFIAQGIERFKNTRRAKIRACYEYYTDMLYRRFKKEIKPISYEAFRARINKLPPYEVILHRKGKRQANIEFNKIDKMANPKRVLQFVEVDHTKLDLFVVDDELNIPLGRPWLTLLIDRSTKAITGFHVGFEPPSFLTVSKALKHSILSKGYIKKEYPHINHDWPCSGIPEVLVLDNGPEFRSEDLKAVAGSLKMDLQFCPVRKPWLKASVERTFGTINTKLLNDLPGKTFSNIIEKDEYDPSKNAVIRMSAFLDVFHTWVIDIYMQTPAAHGTRVPYQSWVDKIVHFSPSQPKDLDLLSVQLGKTAKRSHRRGGITILYLRYDSDELANYRKENGNTKVLIKFDQEDLSKIYVFLEQQNCYLLVPAIDQEYTQNLTLHQHRRFIRFIRNNLKENYDSFNLSEARIYIADVVNNELSTSKKGRSAKSNATLARLQNVNQGANGSVIQSDSDKPKDTKIESIETIIDDFELNIKLDDGDGSGTFLD